MSRPAEDLLRAALHARAEQVTLDSLRPPAPPGRRRRRPGLVPLAVAAAAAAVVGGGVAVGPRLLADRTPSPPAVNPAPSPTGTATPTPTPGPSGAPASPTDTSASPTGQTGQTGTTVDVGALRLHLPADWVVDRRISQEGRRMVCLRMQPSDPGVCDVWVTAADDPTQGFMSVDSLTGMMSVPHPTCGTRYVIPTTTEFRVDTLAGRPADYRAYSLDCGTGRTRSPQQWTVPTWPAVQVSVMDVRPQARSGAQAVVASARFTEPDTGRRVTDWGRLTAHSVDASGVVHVRLNRMVFHSGGYDNGHPVDNNPATYDYALSPSVRITDQGTLCADSLAITTGRTSCPLATVLDRLDAHSNLPTVDLIFDRDGVVVGINGDYHP